MSTFDSIKDLLRLIKESSKEEEVKKAVDKIVKGLFKEFKEYFLQNEEKPQKRDTKEKVPLELLLNLANEFDFTIPGVVIDCYDDVLPPESDESGEQSAPSKAETVSTTDKEMDDDRQEVPPKSFGKTWLEYEPIDPFQEIFEKFAEEEESFDTGKEFDDDRLGDEDWVEPKYGTEEFVSQPVYYDGKAFQKNSLQFIHSFGYNSYKRQNLCVIDENTIVYLSGNYIHVYNVSRRSFKYVRSSGGGGLGHCTKHPSKSIFAVGEKGIQPLILIYSYPSLQVLRVLRGGAVAGYNHLCFSPNGKWLLSLASKPDSSLTVWNWNMERIILKQMNLDKEIWEGQYNPYVFGGIITAGLENITFWKLIKTFTGLKLIPTLGKWSERIYCEINTFCALPKDMVISSNANNNLYLWEEDTLTMEICRRNSRSLHDDGIVYLEFKKKYDEIYSVGLEGKYKVWDFTRIENAMFKSQESLELQPTFQRRIKDEKGIATPMSFQRVSPSDPNSEMYYMQDRQGSIWLVELAVKENLKQSKRIFEAHDGPISDISPSPAGFYIATLGKNGLFVYNSRKNQLVMKKTFCAAGSSLLWLPYEVDKTASLLLIGFIDGTMRLVSLSLRARDLLPAESDDKFVHVIQAFKPHSDAITVLSHDFYRHHEYIVLSGSNDHTIFVHRLKKYKQEYLKICPIGFLVLPTPVYSITWSKIKESFLVTSLLGTIIEVDVPSDIPEPSTTTFEIKLPLKICNFKSVKSEVERNSAIDRNLKRQEKRKTFQKNKFANEIDLIEKRKQKLVELANYLEIKRIEERERRRTEKAPSLKEKEEASLNKNTLLSQWCECNTSSDVENSGESESHEEKNPLLSGMSLTSDYSDKIPIKILKNLQNMINEKKQIRGMIEEQEITETEIPHKFEAVLEKVSEKIKEIKKMFSEEKKRHSSETSPQDQRLKFIMDEFLKMMYKEASFEDIEDVSEDEDVPPRHHPSGPVPIYFADYITENCIWVSAGGYDAGYIYEYELGVDGPYKSTPIPEFEDIEMTCLLNDIEDYLIVGQGNGFVKVIAKNLKNFSDFSNYWLYGMHDYGRIKKICLTYDSCFIYSAGDDSNIFYYGVNLTDKILNEKRNLPQSVFMPTELRVDDYIGPNELSLEQLIKQNEKNWLRDTKRDIKQFLQNKLEDLANKLEIVLSLNEGLPDSQKLPLDYFIVNEEYHNRTLGSLVQRYNDETKESRAKLAKVITVKNQIYNYFLNPIKTHKIYIYAHYFSCKVTTFYQSKSLVSFLVAEREVNDIMMDILRKGRENFEKSIALKTEQVEKKKYKRKDLEIGPFVTREEMLLQNMARFQKSVYIKIMKKRKKRKLLQNLLRIFRHQRNEKRVEFSRNMLYNAKHPRDSSFRLKCDPLFKTSENLTKERKYYQLVTTKRKIHNLMSYFNKLVLRAREMKSTAASLYNSILSDLEFMAGEFKNVVWPTLPQKVDIFEPLEFPENIYEDEPATFPHEKLVTCSHRKRLFHQLYEINRSFPIDVNMIESGISGTADSNEFTPWEMELIFDRKQVLLSDLLKKRTLMEELLEKYDEEVDKLAFMKVEYEIKIAYLKICYLKYFEELQVIKIFQVLMDDVQSKCNIYIKLKHINTLRINIIEKKIKNCTIDIVRSFHKCQMITTKFMDEIRPNPPGIKRFVMKIFNRTWLDELNKKEPGSSDEDIQQEEQSSSSSDEDSGPPEPPEDQIDSDDIDRLVAEQQEDFIEATQIQVEEQCGKELFDYTISTHEKRYVYERQMADRKEEIKSYNEQKKKLREKALLIQTIIAIFKVKKGLMLEEKQRQLNKIRTVVVLDSSQMQHFDTSTKTFPPMREAILFPLYTLKTLEARRRRLKNNMLTVDQDQRETLKHVQRLHMDIDYLKQKLQNIKDTIRKEKVTKLGFDINLPRMEETILRRIIKDHKYETLPFHMKFISDIKNLQQELKQVQRSAAEHIKQNTVEQLQYGALLEQKRQFKEIMKKIDTKKQVEYLSLEDVMCDIEQLKKLLEIQENMKKTVMHTINEIKFPKESLQRRDMNKIPKRKIDYPTPEMSETDEDEEKEVKKKVMNKWKKKLKGMGRGRILDSTEGISGATKQEYLDKLKKPYTTYEEDESPLEISSDDELKDNTSESEMEEMIDDSYETATCD